jgi:hypothetical protein
VIWRGADGSTVTTGRDFPFQTRGAHPIDKTRAIIASIAPEDRCSDNCPGWAVFDSDSRGLEVEVCDECNSALDRSDRLCDLDVAALPEAGKALTKAIREAWCGCPRTNMLVDDQRKRAYIAGARAGCIDTKALVRGGALIEIADVITVRVEMRPPKLNDLGYSVSIDASPEEALKQVLDGRGSWDEGECGFGWIATDDHPELDCTDDDPQYWGRNITVIVEHERRDDGKIKVL